jgi:phosphoenolpyruvate carboxykinase (GTP)
LVIEAFDWEHGVFLASNVASEGTAAAENTVGEVRRDPFAMLPFCGYNMGDYFAHWLKIGANAPDPTKLPRIFYVNWFRKDGRGKFIWPGFGDNIRVLKWIVDRLEGRGVPRNTPIGRVPGAAALDFAGMSLTEDAKAALVHVGIDEWKVESVRIRKDYQRFGDRLPPELTRQLQRLVYRLLS